MWEKNAVFNPKKDWEASGSLFNDPFEEYQLPDLQAGAFDQAFDEIELLGFPVASPFSLLKNKEFPKVITARQLPRFLNKIVELLGYYVCRKSVRTVNGKHMAFGTWIDIEGSFLDTTHFPHQLKNFPFRGKGIYKIKGKVVVEFGFYSLEVVAMELLPLVRDVRYE